MVAKARALIVVNLSSRNLRSGAADHARSQLEVHYGSIVDRFSDTPRSISVGGGRNRRIDAGQCDADPMCVLLGRERASRVSAVLVARLGAWPQTRRRRCRERGTKVPGERIAVQPPHPRRTTGLYPRHRPVAWRKDNVWAQKASRFLTSRFKPRMPGSRRSWR